MRKGFTLIELLVFVALVGGLLWAGFNTKHAAPVGDGTQIVGSEPRIVQPPEWQARLDGLTWTTTVVGGTEFAAIQASGIPSGAVVTTREGTPVVNGYNKLTYPVKSLGVDACGKDDSPAPYLGGLKITPAT